MVDLLAHHSLIYSSVLFKILAPRISAVIDELCCVAIVFAFGDWMLVDGQGSRPLQQIFIFQILDESPLVCFNCYFNFLYKKMHFYSRLPTRFLSFPYAGLLKYFFPMYLWPISFISTTRDPSYSFVDKNTQMQTSKSTCSKFVCTECTQFIIQCTSIKFISVRGCLF